MFVVIAFVAIGRRNHDENPGTRMDLLTPLPHSCSGSSWRGQSPRRGSAPWSGRTGLIVWLGTVAGGMVLRKFLFDEGTALSFVIVTTVFLGTFLNGWRAFARSFADHRAPSDT